MLEPRHILPNLLSCTDLTFTTETNLTPADTVVIHLYMKIVIIKQFMLNSIVQVNWGIPYSKKVAHCQIHIFSKTLVDFFSNFIPKKLVTFNDRDKPWTTEHLKGENNGQSNICKENLKRIGKRRSGCIQVQNARGNVSNAAFKRKEYNNYLAITLMILELVLKLIRPL